MNKKIIKKPVKRKTAKRKPVQQVQVESSPLQALVDVDADLRRRREILYAGLAIGAAFGLFLGWLIFS